jgi:hypothetical protein
MPPAVAGGAGGRDTAPAVRDAVASGGSEAEPPAIGVGPYMLAIAAWLPADRTFDGVGRPDGGTPPLSGTAGCNELENSTPDHSTPTPRSTKAAAHVTRHTLGWPAGRR